MTQFHNLCWTPHAPSTVTETEFLVFFMPISKAAVKYTLFTKYRTTPIELYENISIMFSSCTPGFAAVTKNHNCHTLKLPPRPLFLLQRAPPHTAVDNYLLYFCSVVCFNESTNRFLSHQCLWCEITALPTGSALLQHSHPFQHISSGKSKGIFVKSWYWSKCFYKEGSGLTFLVKGNMTQNNHYAIENEKYKVLKYTPRWQHYTGMVKSTDHEWGNKLPILSFSQDIKKSTQIYSS